MRTFQPYGHGRFTTYAYVAVRRTLHEFVAREKAYQHRCSPLPYDNDEGEDDRLGHDPWEGVLNWLALCDAARSDPAIRAAFAAALGTGIAPRRTVQLGRVRASRLLAA